MSVIARIVTQITEWTQTATETYTQTITDFNFCIDLTQYFLPEPSGAPIWIRGDRDAAYRGSMIKQVDNTPLPVEESSKDVEVGFGKSKHWRRKATKLEMEMADARKKGRRYTGVPRWALLRDEAHGTEACVESEAARQALLYATNTTNMQYDDSDLRPPTRTLRDWADEYCVSKKKLKEFTFKKDVWGWNLMNMKNSVLQLVESNYVRRGSVSVDFVIGGNKAISVRPDNRLSRTLSKTWAYVLLWIFLVYPLIIWPFKRFSRLGGGEWRIAGSAFALTRWVHLHDSTPGETCESYERRWLSQWRSQNSVGEPPRLVLRQTPLGISRLEGLREGEWFSMWEESIATYVRQGTITDDMLRYPMDMSGRMVGAGRNLDGWRP